MVSDTWRSMNHESSVDATSAPATHPQPLRSSFMASASTETASANAPRTAHGLDHLARHVVEVAEVIGQAEPDGFFAVPEQAGEGLGRHLEPLATAFFHHLDELLVNLVEHGLGVG